MHSYIYICDHIYYHLDMTLDCKVSNSHCTSLHMVLVHAAIIEHPRLCDFNNKYFFLTVLEVGTLRPGC